MVVHLQALDCRELCRVLLWVATSFIFCNAVARSSPNQACGHAFSEICQRSWCCVCPVRASQLHNVYWNLLHPSMTKCALFISHLCGYILWVISFEPISAEESRYHCVQANLPSGGHAKQARFHVFFGWVLLLDLFVQPRVCGPQPMHFRTPLLQPPPFRPTRLS